MIESLIHRSVSDDFKSVVYENFECGRRISSVRFQIQETAYPRPDPESPASTARTPLMSKDAVQ